jgi:tetratricopeptide (TPR) repeat protein
MTISPTPPSADPDAAMARASRAVRAGDLRTALASYDDALAQLRNLYDPERRGAALFGRGLVHQMAGSREPALADVVAAFDTWRGGRPGWVAAAVAEIASAADDSRPDQAAAYWETAASLAQRGGDARLRGVIAGHLGRIAVEEAELEEARRLWEEAERLARQAGDDGTAAAALINLAILDLETGRQAPAARRVAEALSLAPRGPHEAAAVRVLTDLAVAEAAAGRDDGAQLYLEQALGLGDFPDGDARERVLAALAGLARDRDDLGEARRLGEEALELIRRRGDPTATAHALHDLAMIALVGGWIEDADTWLNESLALARQRRLDPVMSAASRGLADVARLRGDDLAALRLAEQAAGFSVDPTDLEASAMTLAAIADSALERGKLPLAGAGYEAAIAAYRAAGDDQAAVVCERALDATRRAQSVAESST